MSVFEGFTIQVPYFFNLYIWYNSTFVFCGFIQSPGFCWCANLYPQPLSFNYTQLSATAAGTSFLRSMPPEHPSPTLVLEIVELSFHSPRLSIPLFLPCLLHWESRHGTTSSSFELDSSVRVQYCIFLILLKYTWFTMFQVYLKVVQLYRRVCVCVCVCIFFRFFSIVGYHKMLTAVPCAVQ